MDNKLNMQDIIDLLVVKNGINKEEAEKFIVELFSLIEKGLTNDEIAKIKDFGSFKLTHIQERESIDVNTKEKIVIPAHRRVSFVPAPILKTFVNKPFAHFDTTPLNEGVFADGIPQDTQSNTERYEDTDEDDETASDDKSIKDENAYNADSIGIAAAEKTNFENEKEFEKVSTPVSVSDNIDSVEDAPVNKETPLESKSKDIESQESVLSPSNTNLANKKDKIQKSRRGYVIVFSVVALLIIAVVYIYYLPSSEVNSPNNIANTTIQHELNVENMELSTNKRSNNLDTLQSATPITRRTAKMSPGRTLRLIALDKLGDKEFWVYIYMVNENKIEDPNVVPVGLVLELPHKDEFPMNANNPDEVMKAKELGDELMDKFNN